jgi:pyruvate-ferredoxin/flavodoxin oxidoreductase
MPGASVLVNTPLAPERFWESLPREAQEQLVARRCRLFVIDASGVADAAGLGRRINTVMQICFFALSDVLPMSAAREHVRRSIEETWGRRGPEIVRRNLAALDTALTHLREVPVPQRASARRLRSPSVPEDAPDFVRRVTRILLDGNGDRLPVSAFLPDGTWPVGTSRFEKRAIALEIPIWQPELCVQCNRCAMICPHAAIRAKAYEPAEVEHAPADFRSVPETFTPELEGLRYSVQVAPEDCTGCGLCVEVCPARDRTQPRRKALVLEPLLPHRQRERVAFEFFEQITSARTASLRIDQHTAPFRLPLFEFSGACSGCGETPYVRLLTELFGERLVIANATGCSSIYGGNLPTTPYTTTREGRGPAWSNSLFEDNAEFGLGLRLGIDAHEARARDLVRALADRLPGQLVDGLLETPRTDDTSVAAQRARIAELRGLLAGDRSPLAVALVGLAQYLVPRSLWIVGGDGWAYDIGYGGLDHVLATGQNVNVLVLDTEVYSNTGGQQSKATPTGASAKFATAGKEGKKKDLGLLAMSYGHVYIASIALQAKSRHTVNAFLEAESFVGPSLLIAHSPCIAHGYDLIHSPAQQKRAIDCGAWPLYRFDPRRVEQGEAPFVLDSGEPRLDIAAYMQNEARFRMVELSDPERYARLTERARIAVRQRRSLYEQLARVHIPAEAQRG